MPVGITSFPGCASSRLINTSGQHGPGASAGVIVAVRDPPPAPGSV
ncbi:hypothetical protein KCP73_14265 [Salmonella enterica subsp. enterica]|nr:hypothetical protein KCP73_14265 [Salmonella enterica subsp. enterica]